MANKRAAVQNIASREPESEWSKALAARTRKAEQDLGRPLTSEEWGKLLDGGK